MRCRNEYLNCKVLICDIILIANVNADGFCYPTESLYEILLLRNVECKLLRNIRTERIRTKIFSIFAKHPSEGEAPE